MNLSPRIKLLFAGLLILLISIPLTLSLTQKKQDVESHASAGTTLSLIPQPGPGSSIQKNVNDSVPIDLMIDPGPNAVTLIRLQIQYDASKLQTVGDNPFVPSPATNTFPALVILDGPVVKDGKISELISIGSDTSKAFKTPTKVGTINFKAIGTTPDNTPTVVSFTNLTEAFSSGSNDQASENILSTTHPASITIVGSQTPSTSPSTGPATTLSFNLLLHGIGSAGDNPNPTGNSLSNKNPQHPQQNLVVSISDSNNQPVTTTTGSVTYDSVSGTYKGKISINGSIKTGNYILKIKSDKYLQRTIPGIQTLTQGQDNPLPQVSLIAGDTNNDNKLDILDYGALLDCGYGDLHPLPVTDSGSTFADSTCQAHAPAINTDADDNGTINAYDYNLWLRELSVQNGD